MQEDLKFIKVFLKFSNYECVDGTNHPDGVGTEWYWIISSCYGCNKTDGMQYGN